MIVAQLVSLSVVLPAELVFIYVRVTWLAIQISTTLPPHTQDYRITHTLLGLIGLITL